MNKSHLLNPDLGLQQLRPSSGRPFFESPTPLDPALLLFVIMQKLQQTKSKACQAASAQAMASGRGLHSGFDLEHGAEASPKCQGGKMNRGGGWSCAHVLGNPLMAPTTPPFTGPLSFTVLPFFVELGSTSWHCRHWWTKRLPPYPFGAKLLCSRSVAKT